MNSQQSGLRRATVSWDAPDDHGVTITMYEVTYSRAGVAEGVTNTTGSPASTYLEVDDLITGSTYTFTVRAANSAGVGAQSESSNEVG